MRKMNYQLVKSESTFLEIVLNLLSYLKSRTLFTNSGTCRVDRLKLK